MRIILTGAAGFIGFHLARRLLSDGHMVWGLDNLSPYYDVNLKRKRVALLIAEYGKAGVFDFSETDICDLRKHATHISRDSTGMRDTFGGTAEGPLLNSESVCLPDSKC